MSIAADRIVPFIEDQLAAGETRDQIIIGLVGEGMSLNGATNAYASYAKVNGLTASVSSHKDEALEYLADAYPIDDWTPTAVTRAVVEITDKFSVAESTARDYCKAYSKQLDVEHPVADPRAAMFQWIIDNVDHMSREELRKEFIRYATVELGRSKSNANEYAKGLDLHFAIVDAQGA